MVSDLPRKIARTVGILLLLAPNMAGADWEPPKAPILRIETGMHVGGIGTPSLDADQRYMVTRGVDKTIRVWSLVTRRMLNVIRPPIGREDSGNITSAVISPDGKIVACIAQTGGIGKESYSIYLFDRITGRMIKRASGLSNHGRLLTYSPDGKFLLAYVRDEGLTVYRASDLSLFTADKDYDSGIPGAVFDNQDRLITIERDGFIRMYDKDFRLIAKKESSVGAILKTLAISTDGSKIAVGNWKPPKIDVLSLPDLDYLYSPDLIDFRYLFSLSWSIDGQFFYAGGWHPIDGINPNRWHQSNP